MPGNLENSLGVTPVDLQGAGALLVVSQELGAGLVRYPGVGAPHLFFLEESCKEEHGETGWCREFPAGLDEVIERFHSPPEGVLSPVLCELA